MPTTEQTFVFLPVQIQCIQIRWRAIVFYFVPQVYMQRIHTEPAVFNVILHNLPIISQENVLISVQLQVNKHLDTLVTTHAWEFVHKDTSLEMTQSSVSFQLDVELTVGQMQFQNIVWVDVLLIH